MVNDQTVKPDIIIPNASSSTIRYVLWRDKEKGLAWWRVGGRNVQEGEAKDVLSAVWDRGWSAGMGEMLRIAPNSMGYAWSENFDCSPDGYAALSTTPSAITPAISGLTEGKAYCAFQSPDSASNQYVYLGQQDTLYKVRVTTNSIIEKKVGSGGALGRAAQFEGKWYVPWGASVLFAELTTVTLPLTRFFYYNGSTFTNNTSAATEIDGTAFTLLSGASDYAYWGVQGGTFTRLGFDIDTAGAGATVSWEYWNGAAWSALTVTDGTTNFTVDGQVSWTAPGDWATTTVNSISAYWVRAVPSGAFGTPPTAFWASTADTWTNADAGTFALHFATLMDGSTAKLARAYSTNLVALAATAPLTSGSWGGGFEVGDTSYAITGLAENAMGVFVAKRDNLYLFDTVGVAQPVFNLPYLQAEANGVGLLTVPGTEVALYPHRSGLLAVDRGRLFPTGPDINPTLETVPNATTEPLAMTYHYLAMMGQWIYMTGVIRDGSASYLFAGKMVDGVRAIRWHTFRKFGSDDLGGIFIDTTGQLWVLRNTGIQTFALNSNGAPRYANAASPAHGEASTTHLLYLSETHIVTPMTTKQLLVAEVKARNIGATCPIQLKIMRDGAATANVGATVTADGVSKRYWTLGTNDTAINFRPVIDVTTTAGYVTTTDPQVWGLAFRAVPRPTRGDKVQIIIDCLRPYSNGSPQLDTPLTIRATLQALENAAPVSCKDPNGNTVILQVTDVNDAGVFMNPDGTLSYLLEIEAYEFVNA